MRFSGIVSVFEAEAIGVNEALSSIMICPNVENETDALFMLRSLNRRSANQLET